MDVHIIWRKIHGLARPAYRTMCDTNLSEEIGITKFFKNAVQMSFRKAHFTLHPVLELDEQSEWRDGLYRNDIRK